jgi:beta-fructofuranosidase
MTWGAGVGYAPESLLDHKGRRIMWAALYDSRPVWGNNYYLTQHAWDGILILPRELRLGNDGDLRMYPVEELQILRTNHIQKKNLSIKNSELRLDGIQGNDLELDITISGQDAKEFGVKLYCAPDGSEQTTITVDPRKGIVRVDLSKTSLDESLMKWYEYFNYQQEAELKLEKNEPLNFHIFLDRSVVEVFVNNRLCLTHQAYPTREDSNGIVVFTKGGTVNVPKLDAWKIHPSNPW